MHVVGMVCVVCVGGTSYCWRVDANFDMCEAWWCGVVWCGVVWCGVEWCGVVCRVSSNNLGPEGGRALASCLGGLTGLQALSYVR